MTIYRLARIEDSFKTLNGDRSIPSIYHQLPDGTEAHIFISFLAYCLNITFGTTLKGLRPWLPPPRAVLEKFATIQMIDLHLSFNDQADKRLVMPWCMPPDKDMKRLPARMGMELPPQAPPRIESVKQHKEEASENLDVGRPFWGKLQICWDFEPSYP